VEQIRVPFFHQANAADRHFSEIPTRNVSQQLNAHEENLTNQTTRGVQNVLGLAIFCYTFVALNVMGYLVIC